MRMRIASCVIMSRFRTALDQRRLEPVVILRNDHMTIAHCAISVLQLPCTHGPRNAISYVYTLL